MFIIPLSLELLLGVAFPGHGGSVDGVCYDPEGLCADIPCPCVGACREDIDCPEGFICRWDWRGLTDCVYQMNDESVPDWREGFDTVARCYPKGRSTGPRGYTIVDLDGYVAFAINNHGQILGISSRGPVLWADGATIELRPPGAEPREVLADINDEGQIVFAYEYSHLGDTPIDGVYFLDGAQSDPVHISINVPLWTLEINNSGQVIIGADRDGVAEAVLWDDGVTIPMSSLSDPPLFPFAINDRGHIAGVWGDYNTGWHVALLRNGELIEITDDGVNGPTIDLNEMDQVLFEIESTAFGGYLWTNGTIIDIYDQINPCYWPRWPVRMNNCGEILLTMWGVSPDEQSCEGLLPFPTEGYYSPLTGYRPLETLIDDAQRRYGISVFDINDRGQIVGSGSVYVPEAGQWVQRGFLASPVPGDFTLDGPVDLNDYARFFERFGKVTTDYSIYCNRADFDEDADTDLHDFAVFQNLFTGSP